MWKWALTIAGGVLAGVLGVFLAVQGLEKADHWAGLLGLFVALAGLAVAGIGLADAHRRPGGGQSVVDSMIGGSVTQVRGVHGNLVIGPEGTPAGPVPQTPPLPPVTRTPPAESGDGQSVTRSWFAGPVRQIDGASGDGEIDR